MTDLEKAYATQLSNIEKRSGKSLAELVKLLDACGATKFGERRDFLKRELGMGHGDASALVTYATSGASAASASPFRILDDSYSGKKAHLHQVHDARIARIDTFGTYETARKRVISAGAARSSSP